jgi:hypothetical protein
MGGGIENPYLIDECAGPSQCRSGKACHSGAEEQETAHGNYSARHLVLNDSVRGRAGAIPHLLTIPPTLKIRALARVHFPRQTA